MKRIRLGALIGATTTICVSILALVATLATGWPGYPGWGGLWVIGTAVASLIGAAGGAIALEFPGE